MFMFVLGVVKCTPYKSHYIYHLVVYIYLIVVFQISKMLVDYLLLRDWFECLHCTTNRFKMLLVQTFNQELLEIS